MGDRNPGGLPGRHDRTAARPCIGDQGSIGQRWLLRGSACCCRWPLPTRLGGGSSRVTRIEFEGAVATELIVMQNGVNEYLSRLVTLRTLFESANEDVTRSEFEVFGGRLFENHPGILRVGWVPKINRKERADYEAAAVNDGVPGYRIKSLAADGALRRRPTAISISRSSFPPSQRPR